MKIKAAVLEKMGAATPYEKSKPLAVQAVELDSPGNGEVLVKVAAAGLCHSDLSVIDGNRPRPTPMVTRLLLPSQPINALDLTRQRALAWRGDLRSRRHVMRQRLHFVVGQVVSDVRHRGDAVANALASFEVP